MKKELKMIYDSVEIQNFNIVYMADLQFYKSMFYLSSFSQNRSCLIRLLILQNYAQRNCVYPK